jgi:peptide/nickel transport system substrate-binding protein
MNTQARPWNDVHVRRAVAYALNRSDLIKAAGAYATPVTTMVLPVMLRTIASQSQVNALLKSLPQYPFNLAKAKQEMAKSAYPHGFSFTLEEPIYWNIPIIAQAFAGQLSKIGITAQVSNVGFGPWYADIVGPADKRPPTIIGNGALGPDPSGLDVLFKSKNVVQGQENFADYVNPTVDALLKEEETTTNPAKRLPIFQKLLTRYATDLPYLPLYSPLVVSALSNKYGWANYSGYSGDGGTWPLSIKSK